MSDTTTRGRSVWTSLQIYSTLLARGGRPLLLGLCVLLMLAGAIGGYIFGRQLTYNDVIADHDLIQQLQSENQTYNRQIIELSGRVTALQNNLSQAQTTLTAIMPAENTFNLNPNQSIIVADGRLMIGLIGSPTNDGVNINVAGKPHFAAAGDSIKVSPDPSLNCQVTVQSFDLFKAVVAASCSPSKGQ